MERNYSVYQFTFSDGKLYFGHAKDVKSRWYLTHYQRQPVHEPLKREGFDNVKKEIIANHLSKEDAKKIEGWLIDRYKTHLPEYGYNGKRGDIFNLLSSHENQLQYNKEHWKSDPETHRGYCKKWALKNREHINEYHRKRRAELRQQKNTQQ